MASRPPRIVVVGSANMDLVVKVDRLPVVGETILGGGFMTAPGGKGANQAVAAARLGASVAMVGHVGTDEFGDRLAEGLRIEGIDTTHLKRDGEAPSGVALIAVGPRGENFIIVAPGANARLSPEDVEKASELIASADCLLLQLEIPLPTVQRAVELAHHAGAIVLLNPAPARALPVELLSMVNVLTPDESEAEMLAGVPVRTPVEAKRAAEVLLGMGVGSAVVTLGSEGALVATGEITEHIRAFRVEPVDTTAAGDAFNAALAVALAQGRRMEDAVRFANAAGGVATTTFGAQPSLPRLRDVETLLDGSAAG